MSSPFIRKIRVGNFKQKNFYTSKCKILHFEMSGQNNTTNGFICLQRILRKILVTKKKIVFLILLIPLFSIFSSTVCREIQYYYIHPTNMYKRWGKICGLFTWLKMALFGLKMTLFYWLVFLFCSPKNVLQLGKVSTLLQQYGYKCMKKMGASWL